jgi:hypothetical protein
MDGPLSTYMPALFSHFEGRATSVREVVDTGLRSLMQRRLAAQAAADLDQLEDLLLNVSFNGDPDQRTSFFEDDSHRLISGVIYRSSTKGDQVCPSFEFVFFGWLLTKERIHCRTSLVHKHILQEGQCEICKEGDETADHIFSGCSFMAAGWDRQSH